MLVKGTAYWPFLAKPRIEEDPKYKDRYMITIHLTDAGEIEKLKNINANIKVSEDGEFVGKYVVAESRYRWDDGTTTPPIPVVDKKKNPVTATVGNGSKVIVSVKAYPWMDGNIQRSKLILKAVQVIDLVEYDEGGVDEFDNFDEELADF